MATRDELIASLEKDANTKAALVADCTETLAVVQAAHDALYADYVERDSEATSLAAELEAATALLETYREAFTLTVRVLAAHVLDDDAYLLAYNTLAPYAEP